MLLGTVRSLNCSFGFQADDQEIGRLVDPHLGGGALVKTMENKK